VHAGIAQSTRHNLDAAIMPIKADFGQNDTKGLIGQFASSATTYRQWFKMTNWFVTSTPACSNFVTAAATCLSDMSRFESFS
jgi:hypothetical protein